jgi:ABC-type multidrug transport system fused ATPase/permease subunit
VLTLIISDADYVSGIDIALPLLPRVLTIAGAFAMLLLYDPAIALAIINFMPIYFLTLRVIGKHLNRLCSKVTTAICRASGAGNYVCNHYCPQ